MSKTTIAWPTLQAKPYFETETVRLYHGDALRLLTGAAGAVANAIVTDPPYCSGAATANGKAADTRTKYKQTNAGRLFECFDGDTRDARSYALWCSLWIAEAARLCIRNESYALAFSDWRMVGTLTDAMQSAGLIYRGLVAWDKGRGSRSPHKGYFRSQCEFLPWGTIGKAPKLTDRGPFDGCFRFPVRQADKFHQTGKPTPLMQELVKCAPAGGLVLDPFAGSGTTGVAAILEGRRALLIESKEAIAEIAADRIRKGNADR